MKLNRIIGTACIILIILATAGCKKFLAQEAVSSFDSEYVFDNIANARNTLLGAYASFTGDYGYGYASIFFGIDNDEMIGTWVASYYNTYVEVTKYASITSSPAMTNFFNQLYQGIERANLCIYNIPKMDLYTNGSDKEKAQLKRMQGEALVVRAQCYYELCRDYGDVPAQWNPSQFETDLYKSRASRDTIYDHLLADLKEAEGLLPWRTEVSSIGDAIDERFTKGAAKALRAKIALTRGGYSLPATGGALIRPNNYKDFYQIAHDECVEIIARPDQHALLPSYKSLFKDYLLAHNTNDPAGEFMMVVSFTNNLNSSYDSRLGIFNGTRVNGVGGTYTYILPSYFYMFDSTDIRRDVTSVPYEIDFDTIKTGRAIQMNNDGKFRKEWISNPTYIFSSGSSSVSFRPASNVDTRYLHLSWPLIRFADVLLWFAETENELNNGPTAAAVDAVRQINRRGHGNAYGDGITKEGAPEIPISGKDAFFKFLVRERMLEFGGEGIRKYDLIRWNLLSTAISETRAKFNALAASSSTVRTAIPGYTYMDEGPEYTRNAGQLPVYLYFLQRPPRSNVDEFNPFLNSFYTAGPTKPAPTGQTRVNWWLGGSGMVPIVSSYANGFQTGKSELFPIPQAQRDANPNLTQNNGY